MIVGVHGVRGAVRIKPFTAEPGDVAAYGPVSDEQGGRQFALRVTAVRKGVVIANIDGIDDRNAAEALKGVRLYVPRALLPVPDEEYYHADLIGLRVEREDGALLGEVRALHDFGAGDLIEVIPVGGGNPLVLPFTREAVPVVDIASGRLVVVVPPGLLDDDAEANS